MRLSMCKREDHQYRINYLNGFSFSIKWREHTSDKGMHNRMAFARPIILASLMLCALSFSICLFGSAQILEPYHYQIGTPVLTNIWIDPVHGDDANSGLTEAHPLRTIAEAWGRIPQGLA